MQTSAEKLAPPRKSAGNPWRLYPKQRACLALITACRFTLLIGQGRASKTTFAVWYLFYRAWKYPGTDHVLFRISLASAKDGIWGKTFKEVMTHFYPMLERLAGFVINDSTCTICFPNGSRILVRGLDTPERATKVLSNQFATVVFDESQTIPYTYFALLLTRIPQPKDVGYKVRIICTANWAPKTHWTKAFFDDKRNPETKADHGLAADYLGFTTDDNESIDADDYIATIKAGGDRRATAMCAGDEWYDEIEGALWKQDDIERTAALPTSEYDEIVVAFDPSSSNTKSSDPHGICVAGRTRSGDIHILESYEKRNDVNDMAVEAAGKWQAYECSRLLYEVNQGGEWVPATINAHDDTVYCEPVRAFKGKVLRAEPVAALYKKKRVYHTETFAGVEGRMVTWTGKGRSPNDLDALVYAVKYLAESSVYAKLGDI